MTIEEYFGDWCKVIDLKEADRLMKTLVHSKERVCPEPINVFKAFRICPLNSLRVVMVGQDPYFDIYKGKPRATGIAFANPEGTPEKDYSPSLDVLRDSLIDFTIPHFDINFDHCLESWERQGVLMLNSALTCIAGRPGSHFLMWRPFMRYLFLNLSKHTTGIIYVLMGQQAQSLKQYINENFNFVIETKHPSWYARNGTQMPPDIWKRVNEILIGQNGYGIKWY